jgi:hypothetical protein
MIYDKLLSLYVVTLGRLETDIITETNNVIKTDMDTSALVRLIGAKAVYEWYSTYFKDLLEYVRVLERD